MKKIIGFLLLGGWCTVCSYASTLVLVEKNDGTVDTLYKEGINRITFEDFENGITISGEIDGYKYVDLGLPSGAKWAIMNVGASLPTDMGDYLAWGEVVPKESYTWDTYKWCRNLKTNSKGLPLDLKKYNKEDTYYGVVDGLQELEASDDAATVNWSANWCTPSHEELLELFDGCDWTKVSSFNGVDVDGYVGVSKTNGNTIFLQTNYFWTSSLIAPHYAFAHCIGGKSDSYDYRCFGSLVRPVVKMANKSFTVNFYTRDSVLFDSKVVLKGDSVVPPEGPVVECYNFTGWTNLSFKDIRNNLNFYPSYEFACAQTVSGDVNGYDYVDLGFPSGTLWATFNVGATVPTEKGDLFAWGETETKDSFTQKNYKGTSADAATANWGKPWSMPSKTQLEELWNGCKWSSVENYEDSGVSGYKGVSKYNGNIIFFPDYYSYIWSSTTFWSQYADRAYCLPFNSNGVQDAYVFGSNYVRPVTK
ncbi:MAG: hypothetical protein J5875_03665 [Paludibacteraceae bacterium]|nr:hypothetical protein [Paludibacteraceae bacterium]